MSRFADLSARSAVSPDAENGGLGRGRVLLVDPSDALGSGLWSYLEDRGFDVVRESDLGQASGRLSRERIDIVVLDGALGAAAILEACPTLAAQAGVILLLGRESLELGLAALDAGADDWLRAPHNPREVLARLRALLRCRRRPPRAPRRLTEDLLLVGDDRIAAPGGVSVRITPVQHRLVEALCSRRGKIVTRAELLDLVYGEACECGDRAIDVQISRLRKRLAELGAAELITCYRGVGYRLAG